MRWLAAILAFFATVILGPLLSQDLAAGVLRFAAWLIRRVAGRMPDEYRERYEEEWLAELGAVPGALVSKLWFALRIAIRGHAVRREARGVPPLWEKILDWLQSTLAIASRGLRFGSPQTLQGTKDSIAKRRNNLPSNLVEFMSLAIDDWARTLRLIVLVATAAGAITSVIMVIQLHADRWAYAAAVAATVTTAVRLARRTKR